MRWGLTRGWQGASLSPKGGSSITSSPAIRAWSTIISPPSCRSTRRQDDTGTPRALAYGLYRRARRVLGALRVAAGPHPEGRTGDIRGPTARAGRVLLARPQARRGERPGARYGLRWPRRCPHPPQEPHALTGDRRGYGRHRGRDPLA